MISVGKDLTAMSRRAAAERVAPAQPEAASSDRPVAEPPAAASAVVGAAGRLRALAGPGLGLAALVLLVGPRLPGAAGARMAVVAVSFVSLCAESVPFLLAGAAIGALLQGRAAAALGRAARRSPRTALLIAPLMGAVLPLCDCGVVPLTRQLRDNDVPGRVVTAFAAGAPLTNPIVIVSTALAFGGSVVMVGGRVAVGLAVAIAVALVGPPAPARRDCADGVDLGHQHGGAGGVARAVVEELAESGPPLVLGALAAGLLRALVPSGLLGALGAQPLAAAVAMMALAMVLSLCSQADAFVAASLPVGNLGRLAFLATGPVLSLRLAALYRRGFGSRWVLAYARTASVAILALSTAWISWGPR